mmetsp:Transcript_125257/g.400376  ORF Transcript_125257/g.400376 Transcript_125257/m.400376 type:complete len:227 (-) Transcript_125257:1174-1854(-)
MARERNEMRMATMSTSATEFALSFPSRSESSASSKFRSSRCSIIIRSSRHLPTADWEQELGQLFSGEPYSEASTYNPQIVIPSIARKHCRCHCHCHCCHSRARAHSACPRKQGSGPRSVCLSELPEKGAGDATHSAGKRILGCSGKPAAGDVPGLRLSASAHALRYEVVSIWAGISPMLTSNRSWTFFKTSVSSSVLTKVRAKPLVPKRPARPTRWRYESLSVGMS